MKSDWSLRSSVGFDWKTNCFICSKQAIIDLRHEDRDDVQEVWTLQIRANASQKSNQRNKWWICTLCTWKTAYLH